MDRPQVVSEAEWHAAREKLLAKEKELTQQRDDLAAERRRLPMVRVEKEYSFEGPDDKAACSTSSINVYSDHLPVLFEPGVARWLEQARGLEFATTRHFAIPHLHPRDTSWCGLPARKTTSTVKDLGLTIPGFTATDDSPMTSRSLYLASTSSALRR